jgi:hypothetical protein
MSGGVRRQMGIVAVLALAGLSGCVERRFLINTEPAGAIVYENGRPLSASPADDHFVYYGNYHFTLVKDGFQTLQVDQYIAPPWYQYPGIDFIAEELLPWRIRDVRVLNYRMLPLQVPNSQQLRSDAEALRSRGKAIQPPPSSPPAATAPVAGPAPAPVAGGPVPR